MLWNESLRIALQSLWTNKLRTVLTLLGMVIGVASVITVITLVNGANHYVDTKISGHGADVLTVTKIPNAVTSLDDWLRFNRRKDITWSDYLALKSRCQSCASVGAQLVSSGRVVYRDHSSSTTQIRGWTPDMQPMTDLVLTSGRELNETDEKSAAHVVLVGYDVVDHLLNGSDPLGKEIRVDSEVYTVVGEGERRGTMLGQSQDDWVAMPLSTFRDTHGLDQSLTLYIKAGSPDPGQMQTVSDEVSEQMRMIRGDRLGADPSFTVESNGSLEDLWKSLTSSFSAVMVGIASISLVVGGVVIMNIMLVSVTERTREIGIRKALGARRADLLFQFLLESATMSAIGGALGVLVGVGLSYAVAVAVGWPAQVSPLSVVVGLGVATCIGIFFGVYPANKAARLDPIVALRSEL